MTAMTANQTPLPASRRTALVVLVIALAATAFGVWRERELARRGETIRMQDGFAQLQPMLSQLLLLRVDTLHDQSRTALRRDNFSQTGWDNFIAASEWQSRYPGMKEIGYAELDVSLLVRNFTTHLSPSSSA